MIISKLMNHMNGIKVLLKNRNKFKSIIANFTWKFLKSNVVFLLLQTFELFDKMANIKTIKTILMKCSDVLLKTEIISKILLQLSHGNHLKSDIVLSQSFRQNGEVQNY